MCCAQSSGTESRAHIQPDVGKKKGTYSSGFFHTLRSSLWMGVIYQQIQQHTGAGFARSIASTEFRFACTAAHTFTTIRHPPGMQISQTIVSYWSDVLTLGLVPSAVVYPGGEIVQSARCSCELDDGCHGSGGREKNGQLCTTPTLFPSFEER